LPLAAAFKNDLWRSPHIAPVRALCNSIFAYAGYGFFAREDGVTRETAPPVPEAGIITAKRLLGRADAQGFPEAAEWKAATAIRFDHDWQGKNSDPQRATEARVLWTPEFLYVNFFAHFRTITVFPDAEPNGRRDQLWDRDVSEVFLQPNGSHPRRYKEFEVSPNGLWIDLDIAPGEKHDLQSGLQRRVHLDEQKKVWRAELALPMRSLTADFDPAIPWRVNFFRVEGSSEPRFYAAWRPTGTPAPNFHIPEAFGKLVFAP
jgi:alpha-galactosidase